MTRSLRDLITSITEQTSEDVASKIKSIRHNKLIARPAAQKRARKATANKEKTASTKLSALLKGMSEEERTAFIEMLEKTE